MILAVVGVFILLMGGCTVALVVAGGNAVDKAIDEAGDALESPGGSDNAEGDTSFADGTLTTPDMRIEITKYKVIPVGAKGNEYGNKPVIAFWYETTNLSGEDLDPSTAWIFNISAYQDNNPNAENELEIASLPDDRFLDSQLENIKKGGTVENAVGYELDDETTPVDLVVEEFLGDEIGRQSFELK